MTALPAARVGQLTMTQAAQLRAQAESRLVSRRWVPTGRGRILDRHGRILAADRPAYEIQVDYPVITGEYAFTQAARTARKAHPDWNQLPPPLRMRLVQRYLPEESAKLDAAWDELARVTGVGREEIEERKAAIIEEVSRTAAGIIESNRQKRQEELSRGEELLVEVPTAEVARPIAEQQRPHTILAGIEDRIAFMIPTSPAPVDTDAPPRLPTLRLVESHAREYPCDRADVVIDRTSFPGPLRGDTPLTIHVQGVGVNLVGTVRDRVYAEELAARPMHQRQSDGTVVTDPGGYLASDSIGATGIEASGERELRGLRGLVEQQLDTGSERSTPPAPGSDVRLTLDASLQARLEALFDPRAELAMVQPWQKNRALPVGTPLGGACVVLDIDTGDVLAMVSAPGYSREQLQQDPRVLTEPEAGEPLLNRAINRAYPPGSIVKPLMLAAATTAGVLSPDARIDCTGHFFPDKPNMLRCWIAKAFNTTHSAQLGGPLSADEAIMVSCNIFFFTVGQRLGPERILEWYRRLGVGADATRPALGVGPQYDGRAGTPRPSTRRDEHDDRTDDEDTLPRPVRRGVQPTEAILMGIGQGPISWTPLHAADAYATLARGGVRIVPRLRADEPAITEDLHLDRRGVAIALRGLERAVREQRGTGHHIIIEQPGQLPREEPVFNLPGVRVWGKSGTADSGAKAKDPFTGAPILDDHARPVSLDHAWFVVLAGDEREARPRYAIALVVENGGSGGKVSGPICNQVLRALAVEGYLHPSDAPEPGVLGTENRP